MVHCAPTESDGHSHAGVPLAASIASTLTESHHSAVGDGGEHGAPHTKHCLLKSAFEGFSGNLPAPPLLLLWVMAVATLVTMVLLVVAGGVRGPPVAAIRAVSGRALLTRFCIARR